MGNVCWCVIYCFEKTTVIRKPGVRQQVGNKLFHRRGKCIFCMRLKSSADQFTQEPLQKKNMHGSLMLILKVSVKHLHLSKTPLSFVLLPFGLFCSSEFPLHCLLDTRLLTGKPHALLTTGPLEGCSLPRRRWVGAGFLLFSLLGFFLAQSSYSLCWKVW